MSTRAVSSGKRLTPPPSQMLKRRLRFDTERLPHLPVELWLLIFQLATEVPFAFLPRSESPFDLPPRPTHKELTAELSYSLLTKRHLVLVCKTWNGIATPLLYSTILLRTTRGVTAAWNTFRSSAESNTGIRLGHYVKRIDLSMRDSRVHHLTTEQDAERKKVTEILHWLPNLSIFTMHTKLRGGDATCIADALTETSASTLQTIEWGRGHMFGHVCLSGESWTKLTSSCPNLKSLDGPACRILLTELHPTAQLDHLSVMRDHRIEGIEDISPDPPVPLHVRYDSTDAWDISHSTTQTYCSGAISLDVDFRGRHALYQLLAQCPKLSQLILRISSWSSIPRLTLDSSITHLGLFIDQKQPRLPFMVEGLRCLIGWSIPGVKTLRLMSRHPLLEGENLERRRIREALHKIWAAGLVLENWEGKPFT